jgi:hypothetical protein
MINPIRRPALKLSITLLLIASLFSLAAPAALASDAPDNKNKEGDGQPRAAEKAEVDSSTVKPPVIAYVLYNDALAFQPAPPPPVVAVSGPARPTPPAPAPAVSTAPMTAGEKFKLFLERSFKPPGPYVQSVVTGMISELQDDDEGKKDTVENFFADSMTRAARSFGNRAAFNFFEKFALATIFKQDPRYHRSLKGGNVGYAVSRIFITQGDRGGDQFNASFLLGGLMGSAVGNVWESDERRTTKKIFTRWGTHVMITALTNIIREFASGQ